MGALLLAAVLVPAGAGAQSSAGDGSVSGVRVWSDEPGVLRVAWDAPLAAASDYRVMWAPVGEGFKSWSDPSGNAYPDTESLVLEGLTADAVYRVQVRARYNDAGGVRVWSGAWSGVVSGAVSGGDVAGTVLAGTMTWGSTSSGGSAAVGYSRAVYSGAPDRVGGFEMRYWDGVVVRSRIQLYALAQIVGPVRVGPAVGLSDPVILTMYSDMDLLSGFTLEVGDAVFDSADAVNPQGDVGAFRYWMWDSPGVVWQPGDKAQFCIIAKDLDGDDSSSGSEERAAAPTGLRATVAGGAVRLSWDPAPVTAPLRSDAPVVYAVWRERLDEPDSDVGGEPAYDGIADAGFADSDVTAAGTYRYSVSVANTGHANRSPAGEPVTVEIPELLGDAAPGVARFTIGDADAVDIEAAGRRHDVAVDGAGGQTMVSFEANAFDARLAAQTIRGDQFTVRD